ncbi:glutamate--cysteine ligase [bacterium]|nr:glutamate--cysteine ligase [bacterium]
MLLTNKTTNIILNKEQLAETFISGCKMTEAIGVESEKILVYKDNYQAITYNDAAKILDSFDDNWQRVYENGNLIGLKSEIGTITLEPGSQIEISLNPYEKLADITERLGKFYANLDKHSEKVNAKVLDVGIQPVSSYENINIIPKKRYEYMTKYLPTKGLTPFVMMRETAGIQANFDYKSEEDAIRKLSLALKMSPIISAIYANSPIRKGKNTGYKSFRANSWLNVDEDRCGYISQKLFDNTKNFTFSDYVEILLDVPMIFIQRGDTYFGTTQTFRDFMTNGYMGITACMSDWETHISLYFPDVRLKSYVEIRNHDAQNAKMTYSVPAFWKGIMYNQDAMSEIENILEKYNYEDFITLRKESPVIGIEAKLENICIVDYIKEFFDISYASLKENNLGEEMYLEPVYEFISLKRVPADSYRLF